VTVAQFLEGKLGSGRKDFMALGMYILLQMLGWTLGGLFGYMALPDNNRIGCPDPSDYVNIVEQFLFELIAATMVCYVVLVAWCEEKTKGNHWYGFAIGLTYFAVTKASASLYGNYIANPAAQIGLLLAAGINSPDNNSCFDDNVEFFWIWLIAPILGAVLGWLLYKLLNGFPKAEKFAPFLQEYFGTLFFVFIIGMSIVPGGASGFSIGTILAIMIYCGAHVSGGQYNPAVAVGLWARGAQDIKKSLLFVLCEVLGAFSGSVLAYALTRYGSSDGQDYLDLNPNADLGVAHPTRQANATSIGVFFGEYIGTFVLVLAVLATATTESISANNFYGMAIGWSVVAGAAGIASTTGGAFNPAVWFGTNLTKAFVDGFDNFEHIWAYWVAQALAALSAGFFFRATNPKSEMKDDKFKCGGSSGVAPA